MESVLQYFYHRNVKSRLQRDIKYVMNEHKNDRYSYKKASDLLDDLQNIEQSLQIPSIYNIVVKIGNIMGYIRTIKSAVKNYESSMMMYTQSDRDNLNVDDENDLMEETRTALTNFENIKNTAPDEVTYFKVSNFGIRTQENFKFYFLSRIISNTFNRCRKTCTQPVCT